MQHVFFKGSKPMYFYSGEAYVKDGVITIKDDRVEWVSRSYILGYRIDPDSGEEKPMAFFTTQNNDAAAAAESAKSAKGTTNEGTDGGGQPSRVNRVRKSEPAGASGVPDAGLGSGGSDGAAVEGTGD